MRRDFAGKFLALAVIASWGAASLSGVDIVPDTRKIEPLAMSTDEPAVVAAQAKVMGAPVRYATAFPVFIHLSEADSDIPRKVSNLGGRADAVHPRLYAGALPRDAARYVSNWPTVAYIESGKRARPVLDASRPATFADNVQSGSGLPAPYTGAGSFVGTVDTGLSQGHRDFYDNGVLTMPRVAQWFPSKAAAGVDTLWHGTHVAGIAAGNGFLSGGLDCTTSYTGMAPGARLLVYQSTFLTTNLPGEINTVLNAAGTSPVAVNLSLGIMFGPHDGTSGFEQSINSSATGNAGSKRIISVAAGNERLAAEHFQADISPFGSVTVPLTVAGPASAVDIWADGADRYTVTASVSGGTASVGSDQPPNGATHFEVFFSAGGSASIQLRRTRNGGSGRVDAYVDKDQDGVFDQAVSVAAGTVSEPANGDNVIAVGSFNTKLSVFGFLGALGDISRFSSLGPTRDGRRKPDVAAPGAVIYSARSLDAYDPSAGSPPTIVPTNDNYAILAGTSMAAPHVAGIAALVWESNPSLTGAQMRARLKKTADLPPGVSLPGNTWGNGKVNALRAVSESAASITAPATATRGATVALSSGNSSAAYNPSTVLSYNWSLAGKPPGSSASLASNATASTTFIPDVPGDYTVALSVSQPDPPGVPAGSDNVVVRVNTLPVASIAGPASSTTIAPVTFAASATDPDVGQPITFHWVLVSRPAGSNVTTLSPNARTDNATLTPDVAGRYEIGVRADDGLDNSALTVFAFQSAPPPTGGAGGGGGCSVARAGQADPAVSAGTLVFLLVALATSLALRRLLRRTGKQA